MHWFEQETFKQKTSEHAPVSPISKQTNAQYSVSPIRTSCYEPKFEKSSKNNEIEFGKKRNLFCTTLQGLQSSQVSKLYLKI